MIYATCCNKTKIFKDLVAKVWTLSASFDILLEIKTFYIEPE